MTARTDGHMMFCSQCTQFCEFFDDSFRTNNHCRLSIKNGLTVVHVFDSSFRIQKIMCFAHSVAVPAKFWMILSESIIIVDCVAFIEESTETSTFGCVSGSFGARHDSRKEDIFCSCCSGESDPIRIPGRRAAGWFGVDPPHLRWTHSVAV